MEQRRVLWAGRMTRFTYNDYVVKILLGSMMRKYFALDQGFGGGCCCAIA